MFFLIIAILFIKSNEKLITINLSKNVISGFGLSFLSGAVENNLEDRIHLSQIPQKTNVISIHNYKNVQYYGSIFVGSNQQKITVIFDTGSNLLWIPSNNVQRSFGHNFNPTESLTLKNITEYKSIRYAIGTVEGYTVYDDVALSSNLVVKNFKFVIVTKELDLDVMVADGVMGMGVDMEGDPYNSFIIQLYNQGHISSPKFSFYLTDDMRGSRLIIGDISESNQLLDISKKMGFCYVKGISLYWECSMKSVSINNKELLLNTQVIFDTGTSFTIIPVSDFKVLKEEFLDKANTTCALTMMNQLVCQCDSPNIFPSMNLNINGFGLSLDNNQLISYEPIYEYQCRFQILIDLNMFDSWILGDNALRGVLISYDLNEKKVSFLKTEVPRDIVVNDNNQKNNIFILYLVGIVISSVLIFVLYRCFYVKKNNTVDDKNMGLLESKNV